MKNHPCISPMSLFEIFEISAVLFHRKHLSLYVQSGQNSPQSRYDAQVLVRVKAVGVNPVDIFIRSGLYSGRTLPYIPGCEGAGIIEEVGKGCRKFKVLVTIIKSLV